MQQEWSHFPAIPPPASVRLVTFGERECPYLHDRPSQNRAFWAEELPAGLYRRFMDAGFRRSGRVIYQPVCAGCRSCVPIRVPVQTFAPDKSQRRCWRKNQDLTVSLAKPDPTPEKHALYQRYRQQWHAASDASEGTAGTWESFVSFLYESPVDTVEVAYRDPTGALLG